MPLQCKIVWEGLAAVVVCWFSCTVLLLLEVVFQHNTMLHITLRTHGMLPQDHYPVDFFTLGKVQ